MNPLRELHDHGQSYWIDNLTRSMIRNGDLARRVNEEALRGVTSNPAIFQKAIAGSSDYDHDIRDLAGQGLGPEAIYERLVTDDVRDACDILKPVYEFSGEREGFVSLEVSPHLARNAEASVEEAHRLRTTVDRPNLLIKIPGTPEALPAIEQLLYDGVDVNVTLLFSLDAYENVARAYLRALERRQRDGRSVHDVNSVASFFLSRIDSLVDQHIEAGLDPEVPIQQSDPRPVDLLGRTAIASAKVAYQHFKRLFSGQRWQALAENGAHPQKLLWASTSTKNPRYSDVLYVESLIGPHTINTMPDETIAAFADHGKAADTLEQELELADQTLRDLPKIGIDLHQVTDQLLVEGIRKFVEPYDALLALIAEKGRTLGTWTPPPESTRPHERPQ